MVGKTTIKALHDPKIVTSNYMTSVEGKFSWEQSTNEEHCIFLGKMATSNTAEIAIAFLTQQLQSFWLMPRINASVVGRACVNRDFTCDIGGTSNYGAYHQHSTERHQSLLQFTFNVALTVQMSEKISLDKQQESKRKCQEKLWKKKIWVVQFEYTNAL